jgi:hypothetical protein
MREIYLLLLFFILTFIIYKYDKYDIIYKYQKNGFTNNTCHKRHKLIQKSTKYGLLLSP